MGMIHSFIQSRLEKKTNRTFNELQQELIAQGVQQPLFLFAFDFSKSLASLTKQQPHPFEQLLLYINQNQYKTFFEAQNLFAAKFGDVQSAEGVLPLDGNSHKDFQYDSLDQIIDRYKKQLSTCCFSGPSFFQGVIELAVKLQTVQSKAVQNLETTNRNYLVVLIFTDGETSAPVTDELALIRASAYPISFVFVRAKTTKLQQDLSFSKVQAYRSQFANFNVVSIDRCKNEMEFVELLMSKLPEQLRAIRELGFL